MSTTTAPVAASMRVSSTIRPPSSITRTSYSFVSNPVTTARERSKALDSAPPATSGRRPLPGAKTEPSMRNSAMSAASDAPPWHTIGATPPGSSTKPIDAPVPKAHAPSETAAPADLTMNESRCDGPPAISVPPQLNEPPSTTHDDAPLPLDRSMEPDTSTSPDWVTTTVPDAVPALATIAEVRRVPDTDSSAREPGPRFEPLLSQSSAVSSVPSSTTKAASAAALSPTTTALQALNDDPSRTETLERTVS